MMKLKIITLLLIHTTFYAQAQKQREKEIRLSEESLTKIVSTIVESRENYLNKQDEQKTSTTTQKNAISSGTYDLKSEWYKQKIEHLEQLIKELQQQKPQSPQNDNKDAFIERQNLEALENEIASLKSSIDQKSFTSTNTPVIVTPYNYPNKNLEEANYEKNNDLKRLEQQLDSINTLFSQQNENSSENKVADFSKDIADIKERINSLKESIDDREDASLTNTELFAKLKAYKATIYFDNNSKEIGQTYTNKLNEFLRILENNGNVDILINGFASKKGNPIHNQNLSMQRTEAVKQWLVMQGVHPIRVLTSYHGIDYNQTSDEKARRVEVTFIIRKQ